MRPVSFQPCAEPEHYIAIVHWKSYNWDLREPNRGRRSYLGEFAGAGPESAEVAELVDAADSKSADPSGLGGSSPPFGTKFHRPSTLKSRRSTRF